MEKHYSSQLGASPLENSSTIGQPEPLHHHRTMVAMDLFVCISTAESPQQVGRGPL